MITFRVTIRENVLNGDGKTNVKIRLCDGKSTRYLGTEFYVSPNYFEKGTGKVDGKILPGGGRTKREAEDDNNKIALQKATMIRKVRDMKGSEKKMPLDNLLKILRNKETRNYDLLAMMQIKIDDYESIGNGNYAHCFKGTRELLKGFYGPKIPLDMITTLWLKSLELKLLTKTMKNGTIGMKKNSIGLHMRNIKTICNQAIKIEKIMPQDWYPFLGYVIPRNKTRSRSCTAEEIAAVYRQDIPEPLMAWGRDMYMLSFFLIGINMVDLMFLKKDSGHNLYDGRIEYERSKGHAFYSIKIQPEAQEIINRYPGKKYLLDTMDRYSDYTSATKRINYKLKDIAKLCDIEKPLSTYYARHSWSNIGRSLGMSIDDIGKGLGHQDPDQAMTIIYLDGEDRDRVDAFNRGIIDHIKAVDLEARKKRIAEEKAKKPLS